MWQETGRQGFPPALQAAALTASAGMTSSPSTTPARVDSFTAFKSQTPACSRFRSRDSVLKRGGDDLDFFVGELLIAQSQESLHPVQAVEVLDLSKSLRMVSSPVVRLTSTEYGTVGSDPRPRRSEASSCERWAAANRVSHGKYEQDPRW